MTPLAQQLAKQLLLPVRKRSIPWDTQEGGSALKKLLEGTHFFECSEIIGAANELMLTLSRSPEHTSDEYLGKVSFLPAPRTWIEFFNQVYNSRVALHLSEGDGCSSVIFVGPKWAGPLGEISTKDGTVRYFGHGLPVPETGIGRLDAGEVAGAFLALGQMLLALINAPKIIGRKQHLPNRKIEREITSKFGKGSFPVNGWTEIKLSVSKPTEIDDGEPHEAHLTGKRALHFCRAHLRVRNSKLEYVTSHWRGDPAIGIKQSRYKVAA